jgi:hypothetical protein
VIASLVRSESLVVCGLSWAAMACAFSSVTPKIGGDAGRVTSPGDVPILDNLFNEAPSSILEAQ